MTQVYILLANRLRQAVNLSADLDAAATWVDRWGMLFSVPKSKHFSIGKKLRQSPPVSMRGVLIPQVDNHKHLGLVLNESLTRSDHISSVYTHTCQLLESWNRDTWDGMRFRPQWSRSDHCEGEALTFLGRSGGMLPRKILKIETVKYAFFNVLVNDSTHLLQEK